MLHQQTKTIENQMINKGFAEKEGLQIPQSHAGDNKTRSCIRSLGLFLFLRSFKSDAFNGHNKRKSPISIQKSSFALSGERGIRTPGGVTLNSFQDCRIRPLCHFS